MKRHPKLSTTATFDVLSLFSNIKLLSLSSRRESEPEPPNHQASALIAASLVVGKLQVDTLSLNSGSTVPSFLLEVGSLDKLTELKLSVHDPLLIIGPFRNLLYYRG